MLDLIVRNGSLADGVRAGPIAAVEPRLQAAAGQTIDAHGRLLAPPFVDSHAVACDEIPTAVPLEIQCASRSGMGQAEITFAVAPPSPRKFVSPPWP